MATPQGQDQKPSFGSAGRSLSMSASKVQDRDFSEEEKVRVKRLTDDMAQLLSEVEAKLSIAAASSKT
jgi:hypothetical protein